jgi:hypothetical protein
MEFVHVVIVNVVIQLMMERMSIMSIEDFNYEKIKSIYWIKKLWKKYVDWLFGFL